MAEEEQITREAESAGLGDHEEDLTASPAASVPTHAPAEGGEQGSSSTEPVTSDNSNPPEAQPQAEIQAPNQGQAQGEEQQEADPLAAALQSLFTSVAKVVQGELQCSNSEYELLKDMNLRTAAEYDNFGDFASGLRVFVERLKHKNENFNKYLSEIDGIDHQVTELEVLVSTLDKHTRTLHEQIRATLTADH